MSDTESENPRPSIAAAIITRGNRVLMVRRRVSEGSLSWQFPAGEVEGGESGIEAAAREANEETGTRAANGRFLGQRVHPKTGRTMLYVAFDETEGEATVIDDEELDSIAWVELDELPDYVPHGIFEPVQIHLDQILD